MWKMFRWVPTILLFIAVSTNIAEGDRNAELRERARSGDMDAQYDLAFLYDNGYGVELDYTEARTWYHKAADQGHSAAQWNLGAIYANGLGVPEDLGTAINWYRKAAQNGHVTAQYDLGILYSSGKGIEQDDIEALLLIDKAANASAKQAVYRGDRDSFNAAKAIAAKYAGARDTLISRMTIEQLTKTAQQGVVLSQARLGFVHGEGASVKQDNTAAVLWHSQAAEAGHPTAQYFMGLHCFRGKA